MRIGTILQKWRVNNNLGVRDMGKKIGISSATYSRIENGGNVDGQTMIKLILWLFNEETLG